MFINYGNALAGFPLTYFACRRRSFRQRKSGKQTVPYNLHIYPEFPLSQRDWIPWLVPEFPPDLSRVRLNLTVSPRLSRGVSGHASPQKKIFKIRTLIFAKNEFHETSLPDFWRFAANSLNFLANSLTFGDLFGISQLFYVFQVFQVSRHPNYQWNYRNWWSVPSGCQLKDFVRQQNLYENFSGRVHGDPAKVVA